MTPRDLAAFNLGIAHAADVALTTALAFEIRPDADELRQRAVVAALQSLAEGLKLSVKPAPETGLAATSVVRKSDIEQTSAIHETAIAQGFTGNTCDTCGSSEMKRSGTCLTCQSCGSTTGCG